MYKTKQIIIIILLIISLLLASVVFYQHKRISDLNTDLKNLISNMQNEDNQYNNEITIDDFSIPITDINDLINDKIVGIIYFGRDSCPFCSALNEIIKENINVEKINIYKFDTDKWRDNENFQTIIDKYKITNVPMLIKINTDSTFVNYTADENASNEEIIKSLKDFLFN